MNIVIMGCGKVGTELALTLVAEGHNVSMIDNQQKALDLASEELDILMVCGDGADIFVLREAGIRNADIFIAVSPHDEVNMLACMIVKEETSAKTIARVRNPIYYRESGIFLEKLGISQVINPESLAARDIYALLQYPALSRVDNFANGEGLIFTLHCRSEYGFTGRKLSDIKVETDSHVLACAVYRKGKVFVPNGAFVIEPDDEVTFVTARRNIRQFFEKHNIKNVPAEDVLITGGGTICHYLTERLISRKKHVRIIEHNMERSIRLSEQFPAAEVVCGDGTDRRFLVKQGLMNADAFVALTGVDEENIVTANFAKEHAHNKVITKVNRTDLRDVIESLDIDSAVFPKVICADAIAQYVRALSKGAEKSLEGFFRYMGKLVEIIEIKVLKGDPGLGVPLSELSLKNDLIIASIEHSGKITIPSGTSFISEGDSVIIVTTLTGVSSIKDIMA